MYKIDFCKPYKNTFCVFSHTHKYLFVNVQKTKMRKITTRQQYTKSQKYNNGNGSFVFLSKPCN